MPVALSVCDVDDPLHVGDRDVLAADPADDRGYEPLAQPLLGIGVLAARACGRSVTFVSLAASFASVAACRYRHCPFSATPARFCGRRRDVRARDG
jgi:hypothetical protein